MTAVLPDQGAVPAPVGRRPLPRRRPGFPRRAGAIPYLLVLPATAVVAVILGYPLLRLGVLAFQDFKLPQVFGQKAEWVGVDNFADILGDRQFRSVLVRTVVFCAVNVILTLGVGTLIALLLGQLGKGMRTAVSSALLLAWAMPALTATVVWQWLFDAQHGLINSLLTSAGFDSYEGHTWLSEPSSFFMVATIIVTWMGVPFVAFTLHAGFSQVPAETLEASAIDGAGAWQRFRDVTFPAVKPLFLVLAALSTLWDLKVFTQIYVLQQAGGITRETNLLGVFAYRVSIGANDFGRGAAAAIVMVAITLLFTIAYLSRMLREERI